MTVKPFGPFDVDYVVATGLELRRPGTNELVAPTKVEIALVAPNREPEAGTTWHETVATAEGPGLKLRGPLAPSAAGSVLIDSSRQAFGRFTVADLVIVSDLGRIPYKS